MLRTGLISTTYTCFQGKKQECIFGGKCIMVAIQESCLDLDNFCASFPAPFKVFSNVKDLVLSL